jgi:hypothetical protein
MSKTKSLAALCPYVFLDLYYYPTDLDSVFLIDRVIKEEGLCVYNMFNIVKKHFSISVKLVRSRGGSLVTYKYRPGFARVQC